MRILLVHQNLPGQYRNLIGDLRGRPDIQIVGIRQAREGFDPRGLGFPVVQYPAPRESNPQTHHYLRSYESAVRRGQSVVQICLDLKQRGFIPDVVLGHTAWGELLFVKDVFPDAKVGGYFEYFYGVTGGDVGFDPEFPPKLDDTFRLRILNSTMLQSFFSCDFGLAPTEWQRSRFPDRLKQNIVCLHEGVRTEIAVPDAAVKVTLPDGRTLDRSTPVLTFVCRNLEPYRGFHVFMRALPDILRRNPGVQVLVVGGDFVSYGSKAPAPFGSWREKLLSENSGQMDLSRVHFLGHLPYDGYLKVLQLSRLHVYMTYPFVLSWSMLEAMSCGCSVLGSRTTPVTEMIQDGENGFLFDFFDKDALAERCSELINNEKLLAATSASARAAIVNNFDYVGVIRPKLLSLLGIDDKI